MVEESQTKLPDHLNDYGDTVLFHRIVIYTFISINCLTFSPWNCSSDAQASDTANASTLDNPAHLNTYGELPELSAEEKAWFIKFQEGYLLIDGWQEISAEILAKTPEHHRAIQKEMLDELGKKIGLEWCKKNEVRKVDNSMLKEWGKVLKKTASDNPELLSQIIASINKRVDQALQN